MKIVMVSAHSCIRLHKIALPLIEKGYEVHLVARKHTPFSFRYKSFLHYDDIEQFLSSIRLHIADTDIFHVHNEPSWFVYALKELTDRPVVLDAHDSYLTRSSAEDQVAALERGEKHVRVTAEERAAFQAADAVNFVSAPMRDQVAGEFALDCPMSVLPSYVPQFMYRYHFKEWMGGLVYEGRVTLPNQHAGKGAGTGAGYCDYTDCARQAQKIGMDFHLYAGREDKAFKEVYDPLALVHPGYRYRDLLDVISRHDWGLVGNTIAHSQWQVALPNKLYDYLAAGVPPVVINAAAAAEVVAEHGCGIAVGDIDELARRWAEHRPCRNELFKARHHFAMENHIHKVEALYDAVA